MTLDYEQEQSLVLVGLYVMVVKLVGVVQEACAKLPRLQGPRPGRPPDLLLEEVITLSLFRYVLNIKDVQHYHWHLQSHYAGWFKLPNYQNLVAQMNRATPYVLMVLEVLMRLNRSLQDGGPYFVDTTALKVCENARIFNHRVCAPWAHRGKTTTGWFYGFKLGVAVDAQGRLLSAAFRAGNTDDRRFLKVLLEGLQGWGVGDAGFLSKDWMQRLWQDQTLFFFTDVKKTMKRLMTWWQHALLKMRQTVETCFSQIKHRIQQGVTLARSIQGYMARWVYALLTFCLLPMLQTTI